ncbi:folate-binding protein YgfZ [Trypanosoma brucei equiperdum]|uniref:Folate-binding protein YgfZ n=1 Tax=Trypanosoma brucei equiperdum TaxID=630700 RepID=A0A3L6L831_9TRYP|nr:folate-binding protein YgfZ [Trypanosoma brucei equiperdum]
MGFKCLLSSRALLQVTGSVAHEFLQGLFTNDLRQLQPGGSLWGCFLHHTGRVMCDAYLYQSTRTPEGQVTIMIDVHCGVADTLLEHLKEYRMRKKLEIRSAAEELVVVAAATIGNSISSCGDSAGSSPSSSSATYGGDQELSGPQGVDSFDTLAETFTDPRSFALPATLRKMIVPRKGAPPTLDSEKLYKKFLYAAGVGEGPEVFRPSKTLPFEANTDLLRGVSFHKGCYMGQELTHRTHVMLVTRKRTVPLFLQGELFDGKEGEKTPHVEGTLVIGNQKVGEVLTACGNVGLGLLRLNHVDITTRSFPGLSLSDGTTVDARIPEWWDEKELRKVLTKS